MLTRRLLTATLTATLGTLLLASCNEEVAVPVDPPEVRKDYAQTALNTPVTLSPLANDFDPDAETLTLLEIGTPANGVAVLNPGATVTYTPNTGFTGGDSFTVLVRDASGNRVRGDAYVSVGDSLRLFYLSNFEDYFTYQLYMGDSNFPEVAIPVNRRMPITEGPVRSGSRVSSYTPNTAGALVYVGDDRADNSKINVFVTPIDSLGTATQVTDIPDGVGLFPGLGAPTVSADGLHVYYASTEFNPEITEVVRVTVADPSIKVRVNPALATGERITRWTLSDDGLHLLYTFTVASDAVDQTLSGLYVVDLASPGVATKVSGTPTTGTVGVVSFGGLVFFSGSDRVLYTATEGGSTTIDLYAVDYVALTPPIKLSGTAAFGGVTAFLLATGETRVVYLSSEDEIDIVDLYMVDLATPGVSTRLSSSRTDESAVTSFAVGTDGTYAVYIRDDDTVGQFELYRVDFANPTVRVKLNHVLSALEDVVRIRQSVGEPRQILYSSDPIYPTRDQVKRVDVDVPGVTTDLGPSRPRSSSDFAWSPDGQTMIFFDDPLRRSVFSIYTLRLADPTVVTKLTPERYSGASANSFAFVR